VSAISVGSGHLGARTLADWLALVAAPTFGAMAIVTAATGAEPICSPHGSLMSGMAPMYALMSAFHVGPWLRLAAGMRG
jgi:hypothetical protein